MRNLKTLLLGLAVAAAAMQDTSYNPKKYRGFKTGTKPPFDNAALKRRGKRKAQKQARRLNRR